MAKHRVLIVEDEQDIAGLIKHTLERGGETDAQVVGSGDAALRAVTERVPDLIILDLNLPVVGGLEVCRILRSRADVPHVPIIMLTARTSEDDRVSGLEQGADDYVTKPFSIQELLARVRAQLRRSIPPTGEAQTVIALGDFLIDIPQHRVVVRGQDTHLTPKQFDLLVCLAQHPGQVLTHRTLLHAVWGTNADQPEYLRVNIGQLRKKIELSEEPRYILTEPWVGYRFRPTGDDES
jgi:two-component system, OmpR family, KDP operon response regulator KdpE